jgi:hypothetical protein
VKMLFIIYFTPIYLFLALYFSHFIYAQRYSEELRPPADKNEFLAALASSAGKSPQEIILFDDDKRNVTSAVNEGYLGATVRARDSFIRILYPRDFILSFFFSSFHFMLSYR